MKITTTTQVRKNISSLIERVKTTGEAVAIGRRNHLEALLIKFPQDYNKHLSDITNINAYSNSFDFLLGEPDLYSEDDLKNKYD